MKRFIFRLFVITVLVISFSPNSGAEEESVISVKPGKVKVGNVEVTPGGVKIGDSIEVKDDKVTVSDPKTGRVFKAEDFNGVDLSGQDFSGATFLSVDFNNVNLSNTIFYGATFKATDFNYSDLSGACFINAKIYSSDFNGGKMDGAIFTGADVRSSDYNGVDTSGVIWNGPTECPGLEKKTSRPEITKSEDIKVALAKGKDSRIDLTVNFEIDSDQIKSKAHAQVIEIANALKSSDLANQTILIEGHTDSDGSDEYNMDLSYRRAVRVMRVLSEEYEINTNRLNVKGFGEKSPVASNNTKDGKALNRRVTLVNMGTL